MKSEPEITPENRDKAMMLGIRLFRWLMFSGAVFVAVAAAILYGIQRGGGKALIAASAQDSGPCAAASASAARISPVAQGEVAAMTLAKAPRLLPDLPFNGPDGTRTSLAAFKGRTVLLNLWATWCIPCRQEMPALDRLQGSEGGADFEVVAVNIDTARLEKPKAMLNEIGVKNLRYYADPAAEVFQTLRSFSKIQGLPATLLIDRNGCEIGLMAGPADWGSGDAAALIRAAKAGL